MIADNNIGSAIKGAAGYVAGKEGAERLLCGTMEGLNSIELSKEAGFFRRLNPSLHKAVIHTALSAAKQDNIPPEKWCKICEMFANENGWGDCPWFAYRHHDADHDHVHIVGIRIDSQGKTISDSHNFRRSAKAVQKIEIEFGLTPSSMTPEQAWNMGSRSPKKGELRTFKKTGKVSNKMILKEIVKEALVGGPTLEVFFERIEAAGVTPKLTLTKSGKITGIAFAYGGTTVKGSSLGKDFSIGGLIKNGLNYNIDLDKNFLLDFKNQLKRLPDQTPNIAQVKPTKIEKDYFEAEKKFKRALDRAFKKESPGEEGKPVEYKWNSFPDAKPAFVDYGKFVKFNSKSLAAIKGGIQLAKEKDWKGISISSTDQKWCLDYYKEARKQGYIAEYLTFEKYKPSLDELVKIEKELENDRIKRNEKSRKDRSHTDQTADQRITGVADRKHRSLGQADRTAGPSDGSTDDSERRLHPENGQNEQTATRIHDEAAPNSPEFDDRPDGLGTDHRQSIQGDPGGLERDLGEADGPNLDNGSANCGVDFDSHSDRILSLVKNRSDMKPKHILAKEQAFKLQHAALGDVDYRNTLYDSSGKFGVWNVGKGKAPGGEEKFYSKDEQINMLKMLAAKNSQGRNIYTTPISKDYHFMVLDDSTQEQIQELESKGFHPCLVQESSPGNVQAVFKVQKDSNNPDEQKAANEVVQRINKAYGDENFSGVIHPFRMGGFTNRKPKYKDRKGNFPFVRIIKSPGGTCSKMSSVLKDVRERRQQEAADRKAVRTSQASKSRCQAIKNIDMLDISWDRDINVKFMQERHKLEKMVLNKGWTLNNSKLDFQVCKTLLEHHTEDQVKQSLIECSPAIEDRHNDFHKYADRTVQRAEIKRIELEIQQEDSRSKL